MTGLRVMAKVIRRPKSRLWAGLDGIYPMAVALAFLCDAPKVASIGGQTPEFPCLVYSSSISIFPFDRLVADTVEYPNIPTYIMAKSRLVVLTL